MISYAIMEYTLEAGGGSGFNDWTPPPTPSPFLPLSSLHLTRDSPDLKEELLTTAVADDDIDARPVRGIRLRLGRERGAGARPDEFEVRAIKL